MSAVSTSPVACPLCADTFAGMEGLTGHLGEAHDLYDDEGAPANRLFETPLVVVADVARGVDDPGGTMAPPWAEKSKKLTRLLAAGAIAVGLALIAAATLVR